MHNSSQVNHPLTLDGTVLKESADHVILGVTFHVKMIFEKQLRCFQSYSLEVWYREKVVASVSLSITPPKITSEFCPAGRRELFSSVMR